jgi:cell division protein FtsQ
VSQGLRWPAKAKLAKTAKPPKTLRSQEQSNVRRLPTSYRQTRRLIVTLSALVIAAVVTLMSIVIFSPALAIQKIQVVGTNRLSAKSIQNALAGELGTSLTRVDPQKVAAQLASFSLIESVAVVANPPHTLQVQVTERSPIAVVNLGGSLVLVDPAGIQIGAATGHDAYPLVDVTGNPRDNANYRAAVDVLLALPSNLYPQVASISARSKDDVTLQLRGVANQQIVWGDGSNSALKSRVLAALFKNTKRSVRLTIDVSSPDAPVVRY